MFTLIGKYITYFYKKKQESNIVALLSVKFYFLITLKTSLHRPGCKPDLQEQTARGGR